MPNIQNKYEQLSGEMFFFNFLSKLLQTFPESDTIDWFQSMIREKLFEDIPFGGDHPDMVAGASKIIDWLGEEFSPNPQKGIERLKLDYTKLLSGPGRPLAPPWESTYFSEAGLMFQEGTIKVRNWYRRFNLEAEKINNEPDDHIGLELAFIGYLSVRAMTALERKEENEFEEIMQAQKSFLVEHPLQWVPKWCEKMILNANSDFYHGVALLVRGGLQTMADFHKVDYPMEL